jgi:hypothetical protein
MENYWGRKHEKTKTEAIYEFMSSWKKLGLSISFSRKWLMQILDIFYADNEYDEQIDFPRLMCMLALISDGNQALGGYWDIARQLITISDYDIYIWKLCYERYKYYEDRGERLLIGENIDVAMDDVSREHGILNENIREIWGRIEKIKAERMEAVDISIE